MLQSQDIVLLQLFNLHITANKSSIVILCFVLDGGGVVNGKIIPLFHIMVVKFDLYKMFLLNVEAKERQS